MFARVWLGSCTCIDDMPLQPSSEGTAAGNTVRAEMWNMVLLVVLYMIQGVPLGLTMGSM